MTFEALFELSVAMKKLPLVAGSRWIWRTFREASGRVADLHGHR